MWPDKVLLRHPNKKDLVVEFFRTNQWALTTVNKAKSFDSGNERYEVFGSISSRKKAFKKAMEEANKFIAGETRDNTRHTALLPSQKLVEGWKKEKMNLVGSLHVYEKLRMSVSNVFLSYISKLLSNIKKISSRYISNNRWKS